MSVVSLHSKSTAGYNSQPSTNNTFHTLLTALHYILLFNFTYDSTEEPELPVHQVPDPLECSLLAVKHQDSGSVLGGTGDHQHVAVNVEVGLTLNIRSIQISTFSGKYAFSFSFQCSYMCT